MKSASTILLVEDDPNDVFMATLAFEASGFQSELAVAQDGRDALHYLQRSGPHSHRVANLPRLILLDLNMPRMNGLELLKAIREDHALTHLPVVIFTTSGDDRDRKACAALGADDYLIKPRAFEDLLTLVGDLTLRWLQAENIAM